MNYPPSLEFNTRGKRLRWKRQQLGLSQTKLSNLINAAAGDDTLMQRSTIAMWEGDRIKAVEAHRLLWTARALNVDATWLELGLIL